MGTRATERPDEIDRRIIASVLAQVRDRGEWTQKEAAKAAGLAESATGARCQWLRANGHWPEGVGGFNKHGRRSRAGCTEGHRRALEVAGRMLAERGWWSVPELAAEMRVDASTIRSYIRQMRVADLWPHGESNHPKNYRGGMPRAVRLTEEQKALVESSWADIARMVGVVARRHRHIAEEVRSWAYYKVARAAARWRPEARVPFREYAWAVIQKAPADAAIELTRRPRRSNGVRVRFGLLEGQDGYQECDPLVLLELAEAERDPEAARARHPGA